VSAATFAMAENDRNEGLLRNSTRALQETLERSGPAAGASYTLIGAIIVLGAAGYGLDRWLGTSPWCLLGGLLLGIVVGMWELSKVVWHK
jgi:F0F1-type ATP synthase assembly protein I